MRSKYGNKKAKAGDLVFDSRKERDRYLKLSLLMKAGEISDLRRQVSYELIPAIYETVEKQMKTKTKMVRRCAQRAVHYVADFVYKDKEGNEVVEDVKGSAKMLTPEFCLKMKLMRHVHGIQIKIYE